MAAGLGGVVVTALAEALSLAARAGDWPTVRLLAGELEARRLARGQNASAEVVCPAFDTGMKA